MDCDWLNWEILAPFYIQTCPINMESEVGVSLNGGTTPHATEFKHSQSHSSLWPQHDLMPA